MRWENILYNQIKNREKDSKPFKYKINNNLKKTNLIEQKVMKIDV